jgi:protein-S-isoprenylcysteine O-methyltransferase Ste14
MVLWGLFGLGWLTVFTSTWLINHFELFGLAQPWRHLQRIEAPKEIFRTPGFYRAIRHPIYAGFFLAFWFTPTKSLSANRSKSPGKR